MIHCMNIFTIQTQENRHSFTRAPDLDCKTCKFNLCSITLVLRNEATTWTLSAKTSTRASPRWLWTTSLTLRPDNEERKHYLISTATTRISPAESACSAFHTLWPMSDKVHQTCTLTCTLLCVTTHTHTSVHTSSRHLPHILHWELKHC